MQSSFGLTLPVSPPAFDPGFPYLNLGRGTYKSPDYRLPDVARRVRGISRTLQRIYGDQNGFWNS